ncbi:MAG: PAS domain S-box protein [Comamonadaceae bacterium]|nr:PAS domain S-box protein [Comamonadaceae bacterium]
MKSQNVSVAILAIKPVSWWRRWWKKQNPVKQDRFATLAPIAAVLLFFTAIAFSFWYLRVEEIDREQEAVKRDVEYSQQRLRLLLLERQEQIMRLARDISNKDVDLKEFSKRKRAETLVLKNPELQALAWVDDKRKILAIQTTPSVLINQKWRVGEVLKWGESENSYTLARDLMQPIYSQEDDGSLSMGNNSMGQESYAKNEVLQLHTPLTNAQGRFNGVIMAEYAVESLLRYGVPSEISAKYAVSLLDSEGNLIAGQSIPKRIRVWSFMPGISGQNNEFEVPVSPVGNGLILRAQAWRTSQDIVGNGFFWMIGALSLLTAWMLIGNWRHTRKRQQTQRELFAETNFRRAMENSILTGMRALDLEGRITYVNLAFCQMTGWQENELIGAVAPYPYWPDEDREFLMARLEEELSGKQTSGGFQVRVKRKNGSVFDARLYVSPLIDANGQQTGWMTSMTDITEPNRVREQLAASYERFTIVLEALDASVSVAPLGSEELLFANKLYRQWFSNDTHGHLNLVEKAGMLDIRTSETEMDDVDALAGLPTESLTVAPAERAEIYLEHLDKWLEIRTRYINWADGRLAQLVIATDITARRQAEELATQQAERAQNASRLITMGEMASSVAHELNQPLTAIANYCNGMLSRIKGQQIDEKDLIWALEKTSHQAQRAGQIIHRIRTFVKRSEPNRTPSEVHSMVNEAVELAEIELRRRNVRLSHYVAARLPQLSVDPILIEQVLINLMKNAAESIDNAERPVGKRHVELRVVPKVIAAQNTVHFSVTDTGKGLPPQVMGRLYEAFFSTKVEGMGIGLNLCRTIVESHQGRITAENLYNADEVVGCCFSFWIPATAISPH